MTLEVLLVIVGGVHYEQNEGMLVWLGGNVLRKHMKAHSYICGTRKCDLCLCEKLLIARANLACLLNKRDELISKCRHINKFTLKCFKNR